MRAGRRRHPASYQPPDAAIIVAAVVGVGALHLLALWLTPPLVDLAEVPAREGARVAVEARVLRVVHGDNGRALTLAQDGTRVTALAGPGDGPARGDVVRAVGVATRLSDGVGLSLERVDVVLAAGARPLLPSDLARSPEDHDGARVAVRGELRDDALVGGGARVRVTGEAPPAKSGVFVAAGDFLYRATDASFVLRVATWTPVS